MRNRAAAQQAASTAALDRAVQRIVAEICEGVRHGHFEYVVTCEVIGQEQRRLVLKAGKSFQFVIPKEACQRSANRQRDSRDGSDTDEA